MTHRWMLLLTLTAALALALGGGCPTDDDDDATGDDDDATGDDDDATDDDDDVTDDDDDDTTGSTEDLDGDGYSPAEGDCDDDDPTVHPGAEEVAYDGVDNDCSDGDLMDVDGDGYEPTWFGGEDCDDEDPAISPDATEICGDGIDHDCSGDPDDGNTDADGDGYVDWACTGGDDCDDGSAAVAPDLTVSVPDDYATVADAVDHVCTGSTVHVAAGTYAGEIDASGKSLSILGDDGAASTTLQGAGVDSVVQLGGGGELSTLSGFTIEGGSALYGGGFVCVGTCIVTDLVVAGNYAYFGGGAALLDGDATITDCDFDDNSAEWGGGVFLENTTGSVTGGSYTENDASHGGGAVSGWFADMDISGLVIAGGASDHASGLYLYTFTGSLSDTSATGGAAETAGALFTRDSTLDLVNNTFSNNYATWGGGGYYCWDSTVTSLETNTITGNDSYDCDDYVPYPCDDLACRGCTGC